MPGTDYGVSLGHNVLRDNDREQALPDGTHADERPGLTVILPYQVLG